MGKKRVDDGERINFYIDRSDLRELRKRQASIGVNVSEQIRFAIKEYLGRKDSAISHASVHKPSMEVYEIIKYISNILPEKGNHPKVELKKDPMMLLFSKQWFLLKQMVEMTVEVLRKHRFPDIIFEQIIYPIEVQGTNRTRQERYGFSIDFGKPVNRKIIRDLLVELDKELKATGKITI
jgi:hypothetical protein